MIQTIDTQSTDLDSVGAMMQAAATWLAGIDAPADAVVVVNVAPETSIGAWVPGQQHAGRLRDPADDGRAALRACAPCISEVMRGLEPDTMARVSAAVAHGGRVQLLLAPLAGDAVVRVVPPSGAAETLAALHVERGPLQ